MFIKKKNMSLLLCAAIAASGLTACGDSTTEKNTAAANTVSSETEESRTENTADKELSIVCTIFPEYDWVKQILGNHTEHAEITYLLDSGVDLHSYQPTALDMAKIAECDLFVYVGGESDAWVEDALAEAVNPDMQVINLMDVMGDAAKEEEIKEGMEHDHEHEHSHKHKTDFEDSEVKDRTLDEFNGSWQSTYPYLLDGSLDVVWDYKAENDDEMTAEDYKEKYTTAYETDVLTIEINAPTIEYITEEKHIKADYDYSGYYIRTKDDGSMQVRYKFEKKSGDDEAAKYIVFSDHNIEPAEPEHFHLYSGNDGFDTLVEEGTHFPTYYPASLSGDDIADELTDGHAHEQTHENEEDHEHEHEEGEIEYDEHVWLSLKNAKMFCKEIADKLSILDSANKDDYKANLDAYAAQLDQLDGEFRTLIDSAEQKTLVFGDRFPFRYFADDYSLDYYAAFVGCSAETEASFETIVFLAEKMDELGCGTIFTIENSDHKIAQTIIDSTEAKDQAIAEMNSLQSVTREQLESGVTYLSLMQANCDTLKGALQ